MLGLIILRGEEIVSLVLEGPPPEEEQQPLHGKAGAAGSGLAKAVGRGMAMPAAGAPVGLAGPARGVGGPAPGMMLPKPQVRLLLTRGFHDFLPFTRVKANSISPYVTNATFAHTLPP